MGMYWICLLLIGRPWMSRMMATLKSRVKVWEAAHCSLFHLSVANDIISLFLFEKSGHIHSKFLFSWLVMSNTVLCTLWKCSACSALTWCCFHIFKCSSVVVLMKGQGLLPRLILLFLYVFLSITIQHVLNQQLPSVWRMLQSLKNLQRTGQMTWRSLRCSRETQPLYRLECWCQWYKQM